MTSDNVAGTPEEINDRAAAQIAELLAADVLAAHERKALEDLAREMQGRGVTAKVAEQIAALHAKLCRKAANGHDSEAEASPNGQDDDPPEQRADPKPGAGSETDQAQHEAPDPPEQEAEAEAPPQHDEAAEGAAQRGANHSDFLRLYEEVDDKFIDDPVIEDLIQRGDIACVYGASGAYKSVTVLDMGLHVAAGRTWCGRQTVPGFVCYVAAEAGRAVKGRLIAWRKAHPGIPRELPWGYVAASVDLHEWGAGDTRRLAAAIKERGAGQPVQMVQIDTASCVMNGAREDRAEDVAKFLECLKQLSAALDGAAIVFVHHTGKDDDREERGSYAFRANADVSLKAEKDKATAITTLQIRKARDGEEGEFASFRAVRVEIGTTKFGKPLTRIVIEQCEAPLKNKDDREKPGKPAAVALAVLKKLLGNEGLGKTYGDPGVPSGRPAVLLENWRDVCYRSTLTDSPNSDAKQKAFKRASNELLDKGYVGQTEKMVWSITPTAEEILQQPL